MSVRWRAGTPELQAALEPILLRTAEHPAAELIVEREGRRRLLRARLEAGDVVVKQGFGSRASGRQRIAAALGRSGIDREWRALSALHPRGVPVPEPLGHATLPDGDRVIVLGFEEGQPLLAALPAEPRERHALVEALGGAIASLHANGYVHRDLHAGNVQVGPNGPILLDLQASWRSGTAAARIRDLGALDDSLSAALSRADRVRLCAAALGARRPFSTDDRSRLRAVAKASLAHRHAHARSRTRRSLAPGRAFAALRHEGATGMVRRDAHREDVQEALRMAARADAHAQILKRDDRSTVTAVETPNGAWIVKAFPSARLRRRLADRLRGSPARRAWLGGNGLLARGVGAATPIAFVERRRLGLPMASAVILEDLRGLAPAHEVPGEVASEAEVLDAITRLAIHLHRRCVDHGDLKASHVRLHRDPSGALQGKLIDLEQVRFRARLADHHRIQALAELNASLPDRFPAALRQRAFRRYAAALPFRMDTADALRRVVDISLARRHRWSGADCGLTPRH